MHWQYNPYALSLFLPTTVSAMLALFAWRRRLTPGAKPFAILMLTVATWSLEYALELGSTGLAGKLFWAKLQYVSIAVLPLAWLAFALQYTQRLHWLTLKRMGLLSIIPAFTILLVWTNDFHGLFMNNVGLDTTGSFPIFTRTFALGFWFHTAYSYLLLFIGSYILIQTLARTPAQYRGQSVALLIGAVTPWVGNAIYILGLSPLPSFLDPTTFLFTLSGMALTWGIFRGRLLDIVPIAYDTIIRSMGDGILILDSFNRVLYINPSAEQITGKSAAKSIGQPAEKVLADLPDLLERCLQMPAGNEEFFLTGGESQKYFDLRISSLYAQGRITGRLIVLRDITERKLSGEILAQSEKRYRSLVENTLDGFIVFEIPSGQILFLNQMACELFGYTMQEGLKQNFWAVVPQQEHSEVRMKIETRLAGTHLLSDRQIYSVMRKDGSTFQADVSTSLVTFQEKRAIQCVVRDITEQQQLQRQLQRAQKMEALGTLAGGVAHDLNNILSGLVSYPELLLMDIPKDSSLRDPILTIKKSGEKAAASVQDLLTLARRGVPVTEVLNLNILISEYLKSPEHESLRFYHPEVRVEPKLDPDLSNIHGSPVHLSKTVMNLVSNAAEAIKGKGRIQISTQNIYVDRPMRGYDRVQEGDYVLLTVSDTGSGISSEDMERIFEPFYTKKTMGRSGTGLGMAVVWGTVKDHKGYIDIESTEGKGTFFRLYFPSTRDDLSEEKLAMAIGELMGNGESVLVVDDVAEQRTIASGMLKKLGYSVASVASGEKAVAYLRKNSADLLILDMIMDPGIDGLDTYRKILEFHPRQKAIIASGYSETERVQKAQQLGAGAYVRKPYLLEKIGLAVKKELSDISVKKS